MLVLPWTQNIRSNGNITTLRQEDRPQEVNTVIPGKVVKWFVKEGDFVQKGTQIATLGLPPINGDYAPHLHFQIIIDMQNKKGDYPGVCNEKDLKFYTENCPDPNLLLQIGI